MPSVPIPSLPTPSFELELGSVFLLFALTVLFGFAPFWVLNGVARWGLHPDRRRWLLSLLSCSAAGVLLASCLLDAIPTYLAGMTETFTGLGVTLIFPVPEFILAMGFLFLLLIEQVLLGMSEQTNIPAQEKEPLLLSPKSHDHPAAQRVGTEPSRGRGCGGHDGDGLLTAVRAFVLVFSLSLCWVLKGVALGGVAVVRTQSGGWWLGLLFRTGLLALSLALTLAHTQLRRLMLAASVLLFSASAPLGLLVGSALYHNHPVPQCQLALSTLQGLAVGSFLYIIFMEVLPLTLNTRGHRLSRVTLLLTGFSATVAVLLTKF